MAQNGQILTDRRYEFDWLRVIFILLVFLYHSTRFFNLGNWHVKNAFTYVEIEMLCVFVSRFLMPMFFLISGASLFYALRKCQGFGQFFKDKTIRLIIPLLVAVLTHSSLQVYLEKLTHGQFAGSYFDFLPTYFNGVYLAIGYHGNFAFHGMHLWYLLFLFLYSIAFYGLFVWLIGNGSRFLSRVMTFLSIPGMMYIGFALPLILIKLVIPASVLEVGNGHWGFLYYSWFLVGGFIIVTSDKFQKKIISQRYTSLVVAVIFLSLYLFQMFSPSRIVFSNTTSDWVISILSFISSWASLFAILGFAMLHLNFNHPKLQKANEAVMPFYILHQTILVSIGYFIMALTISDGLKWLINMSLSFIIIVSIYAIIVRKYDFMRFLFGMKTTSKRYNFFQKNIVISAILIGYIGLIVFAAMNGGAGRKPMPMAYDAKTDIVLNYQSITKTSSIGVRIVDDNTAGSTKAIELVKGAKEQPKSNPETYFDIKFTAPKGKYYIWLRGKTDIDNGYTDSVWLQIDDQIGTDKAFRMGNWLDVHPAGTYGWAGDLDKPIPVTLTQDGTHTLRIQPRQVPHKIDQIWLSKGQERIPDTSNAVVVK